MSVWRVAALTAALLLAAAAVWQLDERSGSPTGSDGKGGEGVAAGG